MNLYHEEDSEHIVVDVWRFHQDEPNYRRELPDLLSLEAYALSSSTKNVSYSFAQGTVPGELRVHGPDDQMVWYVVPSPLPQPAFYWLRGMLHKVHKRGKLVPA